MFDAVNPELHTRGYESRADWSEQRQSFSETGAEGMVEFDHARLDTSSTPDGADLILTIKNTSERDWPELASIIPCLN